MGGQAGRFLPAAYGTQNQRDARALRSQQIPVLITAIRTEELVDMAGTFVATLVLRLEPEGIWTATSPEIPGVNIEGDTADEALVEGIRWAEALAIDNGIVAPGTRIAFAIDRPAMSKAA
ncbi:MAG: type II toxin-antitoxin system HicB family antitoxin [Beijerinckiaceae bacterium]